MDDPQFKAMTDFLVGLGTDKVPHSDKAFLAHLIGVYRDLEAWGADVDLCRAGMFHSIYGTEKFQAFSLPIERRDEVKQVAGERAEWLGYLNSAMDRGAFDRNLAEHGPPELVDRFTGETHTLSERDYDDLCRLHLCDWLEQVERAQGWDYRREAYRNLAERLGGVALENFQRVFAAEPTGTH